jgi:hypothetical protein
VENVEDVEDVDTGGVEYAKSVDNVAIRCAVADRRRMRPDRNIKTLGVLACH